ncbi:MAG: hypothetical protein JWO19_2101 [Bryobacterales bacterium]|nr:hypothetical protein [Bryobacterales bacterium]
MIRKLLILAGATMLAVGPSLAWNRAGHMAMAAIAYDELLRAAPSTVVRVVTILRQHPQYESRWKPQVAGMSEQDEERYLFMLAARWPDDVRGDSQFDHPEWHYINYPYRPPGQPRSVPAPDPAGENIVTAFQRNVAIVQSAAADDQKAVALCWIFHLMGDSHQPLHTVALFTTQFPDGDRGGNLFYIRPDPSNPTTQNLHAYWDNILLTDDHYDAARNRAVGLENTRSRRSLAELAEPHFETWVRHESFKLAISAVYRKGKLKGSTDRNHGISLPPDYHAASERIAERRLVLSGYRLADFLRTNFP